MLVGLGACARYLSKATVPILKNQNTHLFLSHFLAYKILDFARVLKYSSS